MIQELAQSGILAIIIMFLGWWFVFKNSRSLARQSEINALATAIEKTLQEIADENYKFWKDVEIDKPIKITEDKKITDAEENHIAKSKLFSSYIEYRCNIIERKISLLHSKSKDCMNPAVENSKFIGSSTMLIAKIRDKSTINAERPSRVQDKYARINSINHLTLKLASEISVFLALRFQPMSEWKWPDNY